MLLIPAFRRDKGRRISVGWSQPGLQGELQARQSYIVRPQQKTTTTTGEITNKQKQPIKSTVKSDKLKNQWIMVSCP